eukprot:9751934-Heterocapsa_arctica.AAC.1
MSCPTWNYLFQQSTPPGGAQKECKDKCWGSELCVVASDGFRQVTSERKTQALGLETIYKARAKVSRMSGSATFKSAAFEAQVEMRKAHLGSE